MKVFRCRFTSHFSWIYHYKSEFTIINLNNMYVPIGQLQLFNSGFKRPVCDVSLP